MLLLQRHYCEVKVMLNELLSRYPQLISCEEDIENAVKAIIDCYKKGGKLILCGNGGKERGRYIGDLEPEAMEQVKNCLKVQLAL